MNFFAHVCDSTSLVPMGFVEGCCPLSSTMDFTIVIPTFRRPESLMEAVSSVLRQEGVSVEILIVDDSPERSAEVATSLLGDPRIRYISNPSPTGGVPSVVRNLAWPSARGHFVHFLDDDDLVADGYYADVKAAFARQRAAGLIFGRVEPFGSCAGEQLAREREYFEDAASKAKRCSRFGLRAAFTGRMLFDKALLVCSASVIRRECLFKLRGFDPSIRLMEDADYHVRAIREFGAIFLDRTAIRYRIGAPSLMHSPQPTEGQKLAEKIGHKQMHLKYRRQRGRAEFYALALFTRTVLSWFD